MKPNTLGLTKRDVRRIQLAAEDMTDAGSPPPALVDLDVPVRVVFCAKGEEIRFSGELLGEWAGRSIVYWHMNEKEKATWRRNRLEP